eukprot:SAG31_NODE_766_length_12239_cov_16.248435_1_plen_346_part_00
MSATHGDGGFAAAGDFKTPSLDELLRISITLSDKEKLHEAALQESPGLSLSEEDKAWLLESMAGIGGVGGKSDADRMHEAIQVVNDDMEPLSHKEYSLDLILFCVEDLDNALNFIKFEGGLPMLVALLGNEEPSLRLGGAWILGTLVQNNPKAQQAIFETGCLPTLLGLVRNDPVIDVRRKAFFAVSALVRGFSLASNSFIGQNMGFSLLADLLRPKMMAGDAGATPLSADSHLRKRALFLLTHLLRESPNRKTVAREAQLITFVGRLVTTHESSIDCETIAMALELLVLMVENDYLAAAELAQLHGFKQMLMARQQEIESMGAEEREWAMEELRLCKTIATLIN